MPDEKHPPIESNRQKAVYRALFSAENPQSPAVDKEIEENFLSNLPELPNIDEDSMSVFVTDAQENEPKAEQVESTVHFSERMTWEIPTPWERCGRLIFERLPTPLLSAEEMLRGDRIAEPEAVRIHRVAPVARPQKGRVHLAWIAVAVVVGLFVGALWSPIGKAVEPVHHVRLVIHAPDAQKMSLVGDFNEWSAEATPMALNSATGHWEAWVELKPGRYHYAFTRDGSTRELDSSVAEKISTEAGAPVAVLLVPKSGPGKLDAKP